MHECALTEETKKSLDELFQFGSDLSIFKTEKERNRYKKKIQNLQDNFGAKNGVTKFAFIDDSQIDCEFDYDLKDSEIIRALRNTIMMFSEHIKEFNGFDNIKGYRFRNYLRASGQNLISKTEHRGRYYIRVLEMIKTYETNLSIYSKPKALKVSYQTFSKKYRLPISASQALFKNLLGLQSKIRHK